MKTYWTLILAALLGLGATSAMAVDVQDADGDGVFSMEELAVAFPALTDELFGAVDVNGDAAVDPDELAAAVDAGVLVAG